MSLITLVKAFFFSDPNIPKEYESFSDHHILILKRNPLNIFNQLASAVFLSPMYMTLLCGRLHLET